VSRETGLSALRVLLGVALLAGPALACGRPAAEPSLAPQLLFDGDEIAAYLDEFPKGDYQIAEVPGLGRFYVDENPALVKQALLAGEPWEPYVIEEFVKHLSPGDTVLDIGAHIGSLTVPLAAQVGAEGRVFAFEPQKKIYRELVHNLALNGIRNVVPLRFALSSQAGVIEMDPITAEDGRVRIGKGGDSVEARTIDSFEFPDVSLIKIDVEGHTVDVLRGAAKTIDAFTPVIIVEVWVQNLRVVMAILRGHGYQVRKISHYDYVATYGRKSVAR
jgi:FkbM family methyltransferase